MVPIPVDCKRHKKTKSDRSVCFHCDSTEESEEETWDAKGKSESTIFEPFPPPEPSWICPESNGLCAQTEDWDSEEDPLVSDEEVFEPFPSD